MLYLFPLPSPSPPPSFHSSPSSLYLTPFPISPCLTLFILYLFKASLPCFTMFILLMLSEKRFNQHALSSFLFSFQLLFSQENVATNSITDTNLIVKSTNTNINKENRINALSKTYAETYQLKGFRVQIYSGNKKQPASFN